MTFHATKALINQHLSSGTSIDLQRSFDIQNFIVQSMRHLGNAGGAAVGLLGTAVTAQSGKRNDGTDSNFMDPANNGGNLYPSQIILLTLIGVTFGCIALQFICKKMFGRG